MNETLARQAYEDYCRHSRKRKSEAGWELWLAAYRAGWSNKLPDFDRLSQEKQHHAEHMLRLLAEIPD